MSSVYEIIDRGIGEDGYLGEEARKEICALVGREELGKKDCYTVFAEDERKLDPEGSALVTAAFKQLGAGRTAEANSALKKLGEKYRAVEIADQMSKMMLDSNGRYDPDKVLSTVEKLFLTSEDPEVVKYSMMLMELFEEDDRKIKYAVRRIALCEEFTLFAVWNIRYWDDKDTVIYNIARKVSGFARIAAVSWLESENDEIKHWLLTEALHDNEFAGYAAVQCWINSETCKVLEGEMTDELFECITYNLDKVLTDEAADDLSETYEADRDFYTYLKIAKGRKLTVNQVAVIYNLRNYAVLSSQDDMEDECNKVLNIPDNKSLLDTLLLR